MYTPSACFPSRKFNIQCTRRSGFQPENKWFLAKLTEHFDIRRQRLRRLVRMRAAQQSSTYLFGYICFQTFNKKKNDKLPEMSLIVTAFVVVIIFV